MMVKLNTIVRFLNKELNVRKIKDSSRNGLQVRGKAEIKRIAFCVDACMELFEKAKQKKCDLVVVHHGLLWKGKKKDVKRINFLKKNKTSLYGCHLPLDLNEKYGNNIEICRVLGLSRIKKFGRYKGVNIGYAGELEAVNFNSLIKRLNKSLKTKCKYLKFGKNKIKRIGVVSGGGADTISEAIEKKLDCLLTGEYSHGRYHQAKEGKINIIAAGHYKTEIFGVKALIGLLKQKFNIETVFIDIPTGL